MNNYALLPFKVLGAVFLALLGVAIVIVRASIRVFGHTSRHSNPGYFLFKCIAKLIVTEIR